MSKQIPLGAKTPKSSTRSPRISPSNSSKTHTQAQPVQVVPTFTLATPSFSNKILWRSKMRSIGSARIRRVSVHGVHQHEITATQNEEITWEEEIQRIFGDIIADHEYIEPLLERKFFTEIADSTEVSPPITVSFLQNLFPSHAPLFSSSSFPKKALWRVPQLPSASERSRKQPGRGRLRQQESTQTKKITQKGEIQRLIELLTERRFSIGIVDFTILHRLARIASRHQISSHTPHSTSHPSSNKIQQRAPQLPSASERSRKQLERGRLRQQESTQTRKLTREEDAQRRLEQIRTDREIAMRLSAGECVAEISDSTAVSPHVVKRVQNRLSDGEDLNSPTPKEIGWMRSAGEINDADMLQKLKDWKYTFSEFEDDAIVRRGDWDDIEALYAECYLSTQEYRELLNTARKIRDNSGKQDS